MDNATWVPKKIRYGHLTITYDSETPFCPWTGEAKNERSLEDMIILANISKYKAERGNSPIGYSSSRVTQEIINGITH